MKSVMRKFLFLLVYCALFFLPALLPAQVFGEDRILDDLPEEETRGPFRSFEDYFDDTHSLPYADGIRDSVTISGLEYRSLTRVPDGFVEEVGDMVDAGTPIGSLIVVIGVFGLLLLLVTALLALAGLAVESWKAFSKAVSKKKDGGGSANGIALGDWRMLFRMPFAFGDSEHAVSDAGGRKILSFEFDTTPAFKNRVEKLLNGKPGEFDRFPAGTFVRVGDDRSHDRLYWLTKDGQRVSFKAIYDEDMNLVVKPEDVMALLQEPSLPDEEDIVDEEPLNTE